MSLNPNYRYYEATTLAQDGSGSHPELIAREGALQVHGTQMAGWCREKNGTLDYHIRRRLLNENVTSIWDQFTLAGGVRKDYPISHLIKTVQKDKQSGIDWTFFLVNYGQWPLEALSSSQRAALEAQHGYSAGKVAVGHGIAAWDPAMIQRIDDHVGQMRDLIAPILPIIRVAACNEVKGWAKTDPRLTKQSYGFTIPGDPAEIDANYDKLERRILDAFGAGSEVLNSEHSHHYYDWRTDLKDIRTDTFGRYTQWFWNWFKDRPTKIWSEMSIGFGGPDDLGMQRRLYSEATRYGCIEAVNHTDVSARHANKWSETGWVYNVLWKPDAFKAYVGSGISNYLHEANPMFYPAFGDELRRFRQGVPIAAF